MFFSRLRHQTNKSVSRLRGLATRPRPTALNGLRGLEALESRVMLSISPALQVNGDQDFPGENDTIVLMRDSSDTSKLDVSVNGTSSQVKLSDFSQINVNGLGGNDTLIIDSSHGLIPLSINYDGGTGFNTLKLAQTAGDTQTTDNYSVGPNNGQGTSLITGPSGTQSVFFQNLTPVLDTVPSATLIVNATNSNNAINYTNGTVDPANDGEVTIDNQESIEFSNKTNLTINALAGDDVINLNYQPQSLPAAPFKPTGLTSITVNAGDPTASDTLTVNGVAGAADDLIVTPTGTGAGSIAEGTHAGASATASFVPVTFSKTEKLNLVGQTEDGDGFEETDSGANATFEIAPGASPYSGSVTGFLASGQAGHPAFTFVPITYAGFQGFGILPSSPATGTDTVLVDGTSGDDTFLYSQQTVGAISGPGVQLSTASLIPQATLFVGATASVKFRGLGGNDTYSFDFTTPLTNIAAASTVTVQGNGPGTSSVINYTALASENTQIDYGQSQITDTTAGTNIPTVKYSGIAAINEAGHGGAGDNLTVLGTGTDNLTYSPINEGGLNSSSGTVSSSAAATPAINFSAVGGTFTLGKTKQALVNGTSDSDAISVTEGATRTVAFLTNGFSILKTVTLASTVTSLTVSGLAGDDTFTVSPALAGSGGLPVTIDGGDPNASDALIVTANAANNFVVVNKGRIANTGTVRVYQAAVAEPDIAYKNVEIVSPTVATGADGQPQLLDMGPDMYEPNESIANAAFLGSGSTLQIQNASIFPNSNSNPPAPADQDYYRVVAQQTGTLDFQVYFKNFSTALLPGGGQLEAQVVDGKGNILGDAAVTTSFGSGLPATGNARVRIPAVAGQTYYLKVFGATSEGTSSVVVNAYNATIINTPAPTPFNLELSRNNGTGDLPTNAPQDDTGRSQFDNVTKNNQPLIYIRLDDGIFTNDLPGNVVNGAPTPGSPPIGKIPIPYSNGTTAGYRVALFDTRTPGTPPNLIGFAVPSPDPANPGQVLPGLYQIDLSTLNPAVTLADGLHGLTAEVQIVDPQVSAPATPSETGFGANSATLNITVDTVAPPARFGIVSPTGTSTGLAPTSDSGALGTTDSFTTADRITNVTAPTFYGTAEANAIIKLFVLDSTGSPVLIGQTTAVPIDGTNADPNGQWTITSTVNLNDPKFFSKYDGLRHLFITAEDLAGNINNGNSPEANNLQINIFLDTQGPQIAPPPSAPATPPIQIITTGGVASSYNIFGLKPDNAPNGPTPLVDALTIHIVDNPNRDTTDFPIDPAILADIASVAGQYQLVGDANGVISISQIIVTNDPLVNGQPATATVKLVFAQPLPDDRFTLTIKDSGLVDPAGNRLDGESNAIEPNGAPIFPTGDGQPGGSFVARFTVDSRPEIGTYAAGSVYVDANGNNTWDPTNTDATNRDLTFTLGVAPALQGKISPMGIHDAVFAGDFLPQKLIGDKGPITGQSKVGFDELAAYGYDPILGSFRWLIDTNSDGVIDPSAGDFATTQPAGYQINGEPVAANFDGTSADGDQIGLFNGTTWYLDTANHHLIDSSATVVQSQLRGAPVVGDFNGDGVADLATYLNGRFQINFGHLSGGKPAWSGTVDATINFGFAGVGGVPVAADMNQDGRTDLGLYQPRTSGSSVQNGEWYWLISNNPTAANPTGLDHPFSPAPLGSDIFAQFGAQTALPIVGNFDPPIHAAAPATTNLGALTSSITASGQNVQGQQWYSFTATQNQTVNVGATASSATSPLALSLYDTNLNLVGTGTVTTAGHVQLSTSLSANTQYLVRVTGNSSAVSLNVSTGSQSSVATGSYDINGDGFLNLSDIVNLINQFNNIGPGSMQSSSFAALAAQGFQVDVTGDGFFNLGDIVAEINYYNTHGPGPATSQSVAAQQVTGNQALLASPVDSPVPAAPATTAAVSSSATAATDSAFAGGVSDSLVAPFNNTSDWSLGSVAQASVAAQSTAISTSSGAATASTIQFGNSSTARDSVFAAHAQDSEVLVANDDEMALVLATSANDDS
jgi:hypothetical protein